MVSAQEKSKEEKEQELKIQQAIEQQKKAMAEQQKAMEEATKALKQQQDMQDSVFSIQLDKRSSVAGGDPMRYFNQRGNRSFVFEEPFVTPGVYNFSGHSMGDTERTTWDFSKSVKEKTFSKEYSFDVEKTVGTVVMSINGDCKSGEIRVRILMPSGKSYSDVLIDEAGNLNWRKSFTISEKENQDKAGEWKFKIDSNKATGYFRISLQTY
jgi:hypothetical protein